VTPPARIHDCRWAALDPAEMGRGPGPRRRGLARGGGALATGDIDLWEINDACAAQVLGGLAV
jgi:acetyl-CoA C-acetyltransferase